MAAEAATEDTNVWRKTPHEFKPREGSPFCAVCDCFEPIALHFTGALARLTCELQQARDLVIQVQRERDAAIKILGAVRRAIDGAADY